MNKSFDIDHYHSNGRRIGSGSYSTVYKGCDVNTGELVAIKVVDLFRLGSVSKQSCRNLRDRLRVEINIAKTTIHPNLVNLIDVFEVDDCVYLIFEYCNGGDLGKFLKDKGRLSENEASDFLKQIVDGMMYLSDNNIIHRDLKPQNILLCSSDDEKSTPTLKIADFGFAKQSSPEDLSTTICGSPLYMAPEVLKRCPYTSKADLWSLGVILYEMVTGTRPITARSEMELVHNIRHNKIRIPSYLSDECKSLLMGLLRKKETSRFTVIGISKHPFLNKRTTHPSPKEDVTPQTHRSTKEDITPPPTHRPTQPIQIQNNNTINTITQHSSSSIIISPDVEGYSKTPPRSINLFKLKMMWELFHGIEELRMLSDDVDDVNIVLYIHLQTMLFLTDLVNSINEKLANHELKNNCETTDILNKCSYRYEQARIAAFQIKENVDKNDKAPHLPTLINDYTGKAIFAIAGTITHSNPKTLYRTINSSVVLLVFMKRQNNFDVDISSIDKKISRLLRKKSQLRKRYKIDMSSSSIMTL